MSIDKDRSVSEEKTSKTQPDGLTIRFSIRITRRSIDRRFQYSAPDRHSSLSRHCIIKREILAIIEYLTFFPLTPDSVPRVEHSQAEVAGIAQGDRSAHRCGESKSYPVSVSDGGLGGICASPPREVAPWDRTGIRYEPPSPSYLDFDRFRKRPCGQLGTNLLPQFSRQA